MLRRLSACLAVLCLTGPSLAQNNLQLASRVPYAKMASESIVLPEEGPIRLIVKFNDNLRVRATADGRVASLSNHDMSNILALAAQTGVTFKKAINHSLDKLATLQDRASALSRRSQPDLGGIMYIEGPEAVMLQVARALNDMPNVEYVEFEPEWIPHQSSITGGDNISGDNISGDNISGDKGGDPLAGGGGFACGDPNATPCDTEDPDNPFCNDVLCCEAVCAFDPTCCEDTWDATCVSLAAAFCVDLPLLECGAAISGDCFVEHTQFYTACSDLECCNIVCDILPDCCDVWWDQVCANVALSQCGAQCGDPGTKDCFDPHPPNDPLCNDPACCDSVCTVDPVCCSSTWDQICASIAFQICAGGAVCNQFAGPCLTAHAGSGCEFAACCNTVCEIDPDCCNIGWDIGCAEIAIGSCSTPDFTPIQGYKTLDWYFDADGNNPPDGLTMPAPSAVGFTGEGHDMPGLWDFGEFIMGLGNGDENLTRGKGAKIGIIEHSAWVDHEDLVNKVIPEPGQTIIHMEGNIISSNHGTATLGIAVAEDNGIGITGMAPEAQGYFFPIVSVEEGGRTVSAMTAALLVFGQGDVLSFSFGPPGTRTLDSTFTTNLLLRITSDLGIISCISAGNSCGNLDEDDTVGNSLPDSGAITVGAGFPGVPFCRLGFSNHGDCNGRVHCQSWGTAVTTTGYGALFNPGTEGDPDVSDTRRQYTNNFGGTSAAAPIIAGLAADLQGFAKMFYGIPLMPEQIRGVMAGSGFPQCLADPCVPGVMPGAVDGFECFGDDTVQEPPNAIGFFPDPPTCAEVIMSSTWFDGSPFIDSIEILQGTLVSGNVFSIRESDNNRLAIKSQFTQPNDNQGLGINYLAAGQITDLLVHAHIDDLNQSFETLLITDERQQSDVQFTCEDGAIPSGIGLNFYEMWNWTTQKWDFVIFDPAVNTDCNINPADAVVPAASRFVRQNDGKMQLRVWSLSLGGDFGGFGGGITPPYIIRHDHINIRTGGLAGGDEPTPP